MPTVTLSTGIPVAEDVCNCEFIETLLESLTAQEREVIACACGGLMVYETALKLGISAQDVEEYQKSARNKMNANGIHGVVQMIMCLILRREIGMIAAGGHAAKFLGVDSAGRLSQDSSLT